MRHNKRYSTIDIQDHYDTNEEDNTAQRQNSHPNNPTSNRGPHRFPTILKMVIGAVKRNFLSIDINDGDEEDDTATITPMFLPWMTYWKRQNAVTVSTSIQKTRTYEMICTTFMIKIINDCRTQFIGASNPEQTRITDEVIECLKSIGGKKQLLMFLTGPAGAGKTTAIKLVQTFCEKFSEACNIPFDQSVFISPPRLLWLPLLVLLRTFWKANYAGMIGHLLICFASPLACR
jgi:flagellar biosynthesis GTPase FlhF